jgi:hypothetical protein
LASATWPSSHRHETTTTVASMGCEAPRAVEARNPSRYATAPPASWCGWCCLCTAGLCRARWVAAAANQGPDSEISPRLKVATPRGGCGGSTAGRENPHGHPWTSGRAHVAQ